MLNSFILRFATVCLILLLPTSVSAGIIVSIDNIALTTGGPTGIVDVNVAWEDPDPLGIGTGSIPSVNIDYIFANLVITPVSFPTSVVSFRTIFDPVALVTHNGDHQYAETSYLFHGNSLNMSQIPIQHAGTVGGLNDTVFNGSDARFNADLVTLTGAPKLLYRFELLATGTATGTELFQLSIDPSPTSQFLDNDGNEIAFLPASGTITVTQGATAVPEPSTGVAFLLGTGILAWRRSRKCRHHAPRDEPSGLTHRKSYRRRLPELPDRGFC